MLAKSVTAERRHRYPSPLMRLRCAGSRPSIHVAHCLRDVETARTRSDPASPDRGQFAPAESCVGEQEDDNTVVAAAGCCQVSYLPVGQIATLDLPQGR